LLTNSLVEDESIHAFCRPWFMFTAVADPWGPELAGVAAPRPSRGHCSIVVGDGLFWIRVMKLFGIQSFDPMATKTQGITCSMHFHAQNVFNRLDLSSYVSCDSCVHEFLQFWCLSIDG
jgi:hypothetical protein